MKTLVLTLTSILPFSLLAQAESKHRTVGTYAGFFAGETPQPGNDEKTPFIGLRRHEIKDGEYPVSQISGSVGKALSLTNLSFSEILPKGFGVSDFQILSQLNPNDLERLENDVVYSLAIRTPDLAGRENEVEIWRERLREYLSKELKINIAFEKRALKTRIYVLRTHEGRNDEIKASSGAILTGLKGEKITPLELPLREALTDAKAAQTSLEGASFEWGDFAAVGLDGRDMRIPILLKKLLGVNVSVSSGTNVCVSIYGNEWVKDRILNAPDLKSKAEEFLEYAMLGVDPDRSKAVIAKDAEGEDSIDYTLVGDSDPNELTSEVQGRGHLILNGYRSSVLKLMESSVEGPVELVGGSPKWRLSGFIPLKANLDVAESKDRELKELGKFLYHPNLHHISGNAEPGGEQEFVFISLTSK